MSQKLEAPKGTRDFLPSEMGVRNAIIKGIQKIFSRYGYQQWDGPAFEYLSTLTKKSSPEIVKEIYNFTDKADRELGLRFELTTTIARMMSVNSRIKKPVKAFGFGKVWRYENTQKGRYREFLQMDADLFGVSSQVGELELLSMARDVMDYIGFHNYTILINNRKILNAFVEVTKIPEEKKLDVFRALDKLQKIGEQGVLKEFQKRGLTDEQFSQIMTLVSPNLSLSDLKNKFASVPIGVEGVEELEIILAKAKVLNISNIKFSPDLIRGFDYYTGPIYEIKIEEGENVGSISGGGRYDKLVETFGGQSTPAVGISFGIERIIDIIEKDEYLREKFDKPKIDVYIACLDSKYENIGWQIAQELRAIQVAVDIDLLGRGFKKQMQYANDKKCPFVIILGEEEAQSKVFTLKNMKTGEQEKKKLEELKTFFVRLSENKNL